MSDLRETKKSQPRNVGKKRQDKSRSSRLPFYPDVDSGWLLPSDPLLQEDLHKLSDCIKSIQDVRQSFEMTDEVRYRDEIVGPDKGLLLGEITPERRLFRRRHLEKRYQLLSQALADLIEVISIEVGISTTDKKLFPALSKFKPRW